MTRLVMAEAILGEQYEPAADTAVPVRVRELGGNAGGLRPRSRDRAALEFLHPRAPPAPARTEQAGLAHRGFRRPHRPADCRSRRSLPASPRARRGSRPRQRGLARRNLVRLGSRCTLREAAVWHRDETLTFAWEPDAWGQIVTKRQRNGCPGPRCGTSMPSTRPRCSPASPGPRPSTICWSTSRPDGTVYVRHGQWAANVHCIKIEIQDHYDEAVPLLETLGYRARLQRLSWGAFATGIRSS